MSELLASFERLLDTAGGDALMPALDVAGFLDALRELPLREIEPLLRATCTHEIDASRPLAEVVDRLVEIASE
jgi:hypothetical protein